MDLPFIHIAQKTNSVLKSALEQSESNELLLNKVMENAENINKNINDLYASIYQSRDSVINISKTASTIYPSQKLWLLMPKKARNI